MPCEHRRLPRYPHDGPVLGRSLESGGAKGAFTSSTVWETVLDSRVGPGTLVLESPECIVDWDVKWKAHAHDKARGAGSGSNTIIRKARTGFRSEARLYLPDGARKIIGTVRDLAAQDYGPEGYIDGETYITEMRWRFLPGVLPSEIPDAPICIVAASDAWTALGQLGTAAPDPISLVPPGARNRLAVNFSGNVDITIRLAAALVGTTLWSSPAPSSSWLIEDVPTDAIVQITNATAGALDGAMTWSQP